MRSSSLLVALQAGCLTLAAPTVLGFSSHQKRACAPGSIEAQETDHHLRSEAGTADQRKAVQMCMRLTLPAPSPENRPRTPSAVEVVPCNSEPQAPETNQMYFRLTLPDPGVNEGHRTPAIVDPSPFATYSRHDGSGAGASGSSGDSGAGSTADGSSVGTNGNSGLGQGGDASTGEVSNNGSAGQTNAARPQGPPPSTDSGAEAESPSTAKATTSQEESAQSGAEAHGASPSGGSNTAGTTQAGSGSGSGGSGESGQRQAGTSGASSSGGLGTAGSPSATNGSGSGDGDSDGTSPSGTNHAVHQPSNSPASTSAASPNDNTGSMVNPDGTSPSGTNHAAHQPSDSPSSTSAAAPTDSSGSLINLDAYAAALNNASESSTSSTPTDDSGSSINLDVHAAAISNSASMSSAPNDVADGPLLSVKVDADALHPLDGSDAPLTADHLLSVTAAVAKHPANGAPATGTPVDTVLGSDALVHLAAEVGSVDGQQSSGPNQPTASDAPNDLGDGPLLVAEVHAAALNGTSSEDGKPVTNDSKAVADQSPDDHAVDATGPADVVPDAMGAATGGDCPNGDELPGSVNGPSGLSAVVAAIVAPPSSDLPLPGEDNGGHLISVKATASPGDGPDVPTPDPVVNCPATFDTLFDDATTAATTLKLKAAASPPS